MANLKEENKWEEGIYQLEVTDPVVGGIDGISNKQAKQLANRTKFLKESITTLNDEKLDKLAKAADSDKLDGFDSSSFIKKGECGLGVNTVTLLVNLDATDTFSGFYRTDASTKGTFPDFGGQKNCFVLVQRLNVDWIKQTISTISSTGSSDTYYRVNNNDKGWHPWRRIVATDTNGDFGGRFVSADHFILSAPDQDDIFGSGRGIVFRNGGSEGNHLRVVGWNTFKNTLSNNFIKTTDTTSTGEANKIVKLNAEGDFACRFPTAGHYLMKTKAQDHLFGDTSEICFRTRQESDKENLSHFRFVSLEKFKQNLVITQNVGGVICTKIGGLMIFSGALYNVSANSRTRVVFPFAFKALQGLTLSVQNESTEYNNTTHDGLCKSANVTNSFFDADMCDDIAASALRWIAIGLI